MIETKLIEVRDTATFIPVIASRMRSDNVEEAYLLRRAGYTREPPYLVLLTKLGGHAAAEYDPSSHHGLARTLPIAHEWIEQHWNGIRSGDVVDVEYILGQRAEPQASERLKLQEYGDETL